MKRLWIEEDTEHNEQYMRPATPEDIKALTRPNYVTSEALEAVIFEAFNRHEAGAWEYGPLDIGNDNRDFVSEAIEELLDSINYLAYQIIRLRQLKEDS